MITRDDVRRTVLALVRSAVELLLLDGVGGTKAPDLQLGVEPSRSFRSLPNWERRYDEAVAAVEPERLAEYEAAKAEYERKIRRLMAAELRTIRRSGLPLIRSALESAYVPADLRRWGYRQLKRAVKSHNPWAVAYVALILREAIAWEAAHDPTMSEWRGALEEAQEAWVAHAESREFDGYDGFGSEGFRFMESEATSIGR